MNTRARRPQVDIVRRTSGPAQAMTSAKKIKLINDSTHVSLLRPSIDELAAISGCHVTRPPDATFGEPEFEREYFIKSMLCRYADGQAFTYSEINGKKSIVEEGWCHVLNEMLAWGSMDRGSPEVPYHADYDPNVRLKIKTAFECPSVDILPDWHPQAEMMHHFQCYPTYSGLFTQPGSVRKCKMNQLFKAIQLTQYQTLPYQFPSIKVISNDYPHPIAGIIKGQFFEIFRNRI